MSIVTEAKVTQRREVFDSLSKDSWLVVFVVFVFVIAAGASPPQAAPFDVPSSTSPLFRYVLTAGTSAAYSSRYEP